MIQVMCVHSPVKKVVVFSAPAIELVGKPIDKLKVIRSEARYATKEFLMRDEPGKYAFNVEDIQVHALD